MKKNTRYTPEIDSASKIVKVDQKTNSTYNSEGFDPQTKDNTLGYTSARVLKPVYNVYKKDPQKPKVFGYYTDWSQYDGRLDSLSGAANYGRGYDLAEIDVFAYDKIVIGFLGIVGDQGEKKCAIETAAKSMSGGDPNYLETMKDRALFIDLWGDIASYRNVGLPDPAGNWNVCDPFLPPACGNQNVNTEGCVGYEKYMYEDRIKAQDDKARGILSGLYFLKQRALQAGHDLELAFSIGGWTVSGQFSVIAEDESRRKVFVESIVDIFTRFPMFDEVDLDWEYPGGAGLPSNSSSPEDGENLATLIRELKKALNNKFPGVKKKVSIACNANPDKMEDANLKGLFAAGLDHANLMTYDFFGSTYSDEGEVGRRSLAHHTNLKGHGLLSIDKAVKYLEEQNIDLSKINIGWAGYSRSAKEVDITSFSPLAGTCKINNPGAGDNVIGGFESSVSEYPEICYNFIDFDNQTTRNGFELYTDEDADSDYLYNPKTKVFMSIDTPRSCFNKGKYAQEKGLGGIFTWTIDHDKGLLLNAIREGCGFEIQTQNIDMDPFYDLGSGGGLPSGMSLSIEPSSLSLDEKTSGSLKAVASDADGGSLSYQWTFPEGLTVSGSLNNPTVNFTAEDVTGNQSYDVSVKVTSTSGNQKTKAVKVQVKDLDQLICTDPDAANYDAWVNSIDYKAGQRVNYKDLVWEAKWQGNIGTTPDQSDAWKLISDVVADWSSAAAYSQGSYVNYANKQFIAAVWAPAGAVPGDSIEPGSGKQYWTENGNASCSKN